MNFKAALAFSLVGRGIPFFYYGSEQGFRGGADPNCREIIWNNFDKNHEIYKFI
jgi:alpha-amylase